MKGKRAHKGTGGANEAEADIKDKPADRTEPSGPSKESEELKRGGRAKRKRGGKTEMKVEGHKNAMHAGRKPRKSGGRTGSDGSPFSSARKGSEPAGRSEMAESQG